jgi:SAM-dependent methyltransferase
MAAADTSWIGSMPEVAMVSWAQQRVSGPNWLPADAQRLEFPDGSFDTVLCQFGVMFFRDKPAAFAEAARVLDPDGALLFTVWDVVETSDFPAALVESLTAVLGDGPPDFVVRIPHGYHDVDRIENDLEAGGMQLEQVDRLVLRGRAPSAATVAEGFCCGTPLRFALEERGDIAQVTEAVGAEMTARLGSGPVEGDLAGYVVVARPSG